MINIQKVKNWIPEIVHSSLSEEQKSTWTLRAFGLTKVPLLFLTSPRILAIDQEKCEVVMPFRKIVKNHLGSMYFGALAIGADTCVGMLAMHKIQSADLKVSLVFKDFSIQFLKRPEADTTFVCEEGQTIQDMIDQTVETGERVSLAIPGKAVCNGETVATFHLTLSLKKRS